ncbi:ATP synthase F0 subunit B [Rhodococcus sp. IEGM 1374]|uniref:ATP synthase F0 subunit B n=1 Tax=Rhodococcus sp. IEGM 1374 TaxID=3082221 RepID=UPI002953F531|nr:ATP synthase F0 subunit B [Rhodococcus sp. IEGM 1374]MDV7992067.1 ATP synthase F0 subunit B [Rhodococcus sp. IEGM 1374]
MTKLTVLSPIIHDQTEYKPGDKFEGDDKVVADLIAAGALEDPNREKTVQESSELDEAKAQAQELRGAAEKELADAKAEAAKILDDANTEADKIKADAKAEGQAAIKAAQDAAKNGAQTKPSTPTK